jgi:uncharacterized membrane protein
MPMMSERMMRAVRSPAAARLGWVLLVSLASLVVGSWLLLTPGGLLGKADAVGYAVCHRIDARSFHLGERQLPLCARCSGTYLGVVAAVGGLLALGRGKSGAFPAWPYLSLFGLFGLLWAVDGVNSYLHLFPGAPGLYEPSNVLRLITGSLMGLSLGVLVFTGFNQAVWRDWRREASVRRPLDMLWLLTAAGLMVVLVLWENVVVLYPLAVISAASVVGLLTAVYSVIAVMVLRRENQASGWRDVRVPLLIGFTLAVLQIALIDAARLAVTNTWGGFPL